ncbi:MAG TPA: 3-oxoacyl-ACP reductase FabG, partial [Acidimicrobiales bacterium]
MGALEGRVAIVTGAGRGVGREEALLLAAEGAAVVVNDLGGATDGTGRDVGPAEEVVEEIRAAGGRAVANGADVSDWDAATAMVEQAVGEFGRLDVLVNNAGITIDKTVLKMSDEDWYKVIAVNLSGAFFMSQAVLPHMIERASGRIINISSIIGETGNIGQANYAASKSGLFGLTKSLALETARKGITVNCVAPGFIDTEMVAAVPKEVLDRVVASIPMRRLGHPDEIAHAVRFLL